MRPPCTIAECYVDIRVGSHTPDNTGGGDAVSSSHGTDVTATIPVQALVSSVRSQAAQTSILCLACTSSRAALTCDEPSLPCTRLTVVWVWAVSQPHIRLAMCSLCIAELSHSVWLQSTLPALTRGSMHPSHLGAAHPPACACTCAHCCIAASAGGDNSYMCSLLQICVCRRQ